uniref:Piwi domain-containing protein n=1 Tax=Chromera velia CCMP2878 TaxID=1169474 RepID=A0A0G4HEY2_9ALVE|eukprot:Cvel_26922.t1-p1 / transcript=Cvel_26922.t1 / gene=Cvel_26922 / organism=Chromera_velia_CCMP2878 / gene_product=Protein argonaute 3, putative / transcript_product=Protein argonaute 3, putative / location=Cvel_scaffold3276:7932-13110(+) / protein_length=1033 / sequence_SO=supercontig / SO=protein_coding / is_pseudo=false
MDSSGWKKIDLHVNYFPLSVDPNSVLYRHDVVYKATAGPDGLRSKEKEKAIEKQCAIWKRKDLLAGWDGNDALVWPEEINLLGDVLSIVRADENHAIPMSDPSSPSKPHHERKLMMDCVNVILANAATYRKREAGGLQAAVECTKKGRAFYPKHPGYIFPIASKIPSHMGVLGTAGWFGFVASAGLTGNRGGTGSLNVVVNVQTGLAYEPDLTLRDFLERVVAKKPLEQLSPLENEEMSHHKQVQGLKLCCKGKRSAYTLYRVDMDPSKRAGTVTFKTKEDGEISVASYWNTHLVPELREQNIPHIRDDEPLAEMAGGVHIPLCCCLVEPFQVPARGAFEAEKQVLQEFGCMKAPQRKRHIEKVVAEIFHPERNSVLSHFGFRVSTVMTRVEGKLMPVAPLFMSSARRQQEGTERVRVDEGEAKWNTLRNQCAKKCPAAAAGVSLPFCIVTFDQRIQGDFGTPCVQSYMWEFRQKLATEFNIQIPECPVFVLQVNFSAHGVSPAGGGRGGRGGRGGGRGGRGGGRGGGGGGAPPPRKGGVEEYENQADEDERARYLQGLEDNLIRQWDYQMNQIADKAFKYRDGRANSQYMSNVALKVNTQLGGTNWVLDAAGAEGMAYIRELFSKEKHDICVLGADVTHPSSQAGATRVQPSVAAMVCSVDEHLSQWTHCVRAQTGTRLKSAAQEVIGSEDYPLFKEMFAACMENRKLWKVAGRQHTQTDMMPPRHVVIFRDGVSDEQINSVLDSELAQIKDYYHNVAKQKNFDPDAFVAGIRFTVIVVQKRHNARLFSAIPVTGDPSLRQTAPQPPVVLTGPGEASGRGRGERGGRGGGRGGRGGGGRGFQMEDLRSFTAEGENPPPGTILESEVQNLMLPSNTTSFWLCSHKGVIGTAHPALYILREDAIVQPMPNKDITPLSIDAMKLFIYHLCHLSQRTSKAVSYPVPTFYADMVAEHGMKHLWRHKFKWKQETNELKKRPQPGEKDLTVEEKLRKSAQLRQKAVADANEALKRTVPLNDFPTAPFVQIPPPGAMFYV